jgi:hypothetical protein
VEQEQGPRNLTEGDVKALVAEMRAQVTEQFFQDLGKGLWGLFRASFLAVILAVLGYATWMKVKE